MRPFRSVMSTDSVDATQRRLYLAGSILTLLLTGVGLNSLSPSLKLLSSASLAGLIFYWFVVQKPRLARPVVILAAPLAGLIAVQSFSLLWTPLLRPSTELLLQNTLLLGFFLLVMTSVLSGWPARSWLEAVLLIAGALCLIELLLVVSWLRHWLAIGSELSIFPPVGYRASGLLLGHPNVLSGFINLAVPLVVYQILRSSSLSNRLGLVLFLGLLLTTQYFTSSRTGWISLAASLLVMAVLFMLSEGIRESGLLERSITRLARWGAGQWTAFAAVLVAGGYALFWQISRTGHAPLSRARLPVWEASLNLIRQSPILGTGLGSFPPLFAAQSLMHDVESVPHAHNLLLQLYIDSGISGVALAATFAALVGAYGIRHWKASSAADRRMIATFAALAAGILTHHLADYLFGPALYAMAVACVVGVFAGTAINAESEGGVTSEISVGRWIGGLSLATVVGIGLLLSGAWTHWDASLAARNKSWEEAKLQACSSYAEHSDQAAYASTCAVAAEFSALHSGEELPNHEAFMAAARADPAWYLHWANTSANFRAHGDYSQAVSAMDRAIDRAPHSAELMLNRGYLEELRGDRASAASYYRRAARLDPWITTTAFIRSSEFRKGAVLGLRLEGYQEGWRAPLWRAQEAFEAGDLRGAVDHLERTIEINPREAKAYALLAQVHLRSGEIDEAEQYAALAEFIRPTDPWVMQTAIEVQRAVGSPQLAEARLMEATDSLLNRSSSERYFFAAYRRYSFQVDRHPGLIRADIPAPLAAAAAEVLERGELNQKDTYAARLLLRQAGAEAKSDPR